MKKEIDCQFFEDQLDAHSRGELSEEGLDQLRLHAQACADCAMQLRVKDHLALPSLEEMETEVPQEYLDSMWSRVQAEVSARNPGATPARHFPWLVPAMAASIVALLFSTGFLFRKLQQVKAGQEILAPQVFQNMNLIAEASERAATDQGIAALAGWTRLDREILSKENHTVGEVAEILGARRGNQRLCTAAQLSAFLENASTETPPEWRTALASLDDDGWITARALLSVLESVEADPRLTFPSPELRELLSGGVRSAET